MLDLATIRRERATRFAYWRKRGVYSDLTYADYLAEGARKFAATRLVFHSQVRPATTTAAEMDRQGERLAAGFHRIGLKLGDRIAVMLPTWSEATAAYVAAFKLGLVVVPIVAIYGARELGFILRQTGAKALILPDRWRSSEYLDRLANAGATPDLERVIVVGQAVPSGALGWDDLTALADDAYSRATPTADETCLIIYTSGTTSEPKGVKHTHNTLLCDLNAARSVGGAPMGIPHGPSLCVFPAGHIAGFLAMMRPILQGAETVFMDRWNANDGARLIEEHQIASSTGTPVFLSSLMQAAEKTGANITSLQRFGLGAGAVTPENVRWTDQQGFPSARIYGLTEHPAVSAGGDDPFEKRAYTDGRITERNEVRILDENDADVPVGQTGEIATRGPRLFAGYVEERLDAECFLPGGWFKTGDIGRMDAEGYLTINDRKKDIIIRGGENISSKEVEDILASMPGLIESAVTAARDPVMGERVCAFVVAQRGVEITLEDVADHFRRLGVTRQKTPERVIQLDDLPRTPSGKVKKTDLRASLREPAEAAK